MPWEKNFDIDVATDSAVRIFWLKGCEATSMSELIKGMEINKGSLYNAFGNKKSLFVRALLKHDRNNRHSAITQLSEMDDPVRAIRTLFDGLIAESEDDTDRKGCMLLNTALDLPNHESDVQEMVINALQEFEEFFVNQIKIGQQRGEVHNKLDPNTTANSLLTFVVGIRGLARGAFDGAALRKIRNQALKLIDN